MDYEEVIFDTLRFGEEMKQSLSHVKKTPRAIAASILHDVLSDGAYAGVALRRGLSKSSLSTSERSFVTECVNETLRNLLRIDSTINSHASLPVQKMKPMIACILRCGVCQMHMLRQSTHAVIFEAVNIAKAFGFVNLSGFVNAVLRAAAKSISEHPAHDSEQEEDLAAMYSYPAWLAKALQAWLGCDDARRFMEASHKPAPMCVVANTILTTPAQLMADLATQGIECVELGDSHKKVPNALILRRTGDISQLPQFTCGHFHVMDAAAAYAADALCAAPCQTIIDMCAAPGGKAFRIAANMRNKGRILAFDTHPHKITLLERTARRLGIGIIKVAVGDAGQPNPELFGVADAVLLDAPCSGLGTLRRHPEIKYSRTMDDTLALAHQQKVMLNNAANYVKPGGAVLYSVCTVATLECEDVVQNFLESHGDFSLALAEKILPCELFDGFYIARLEKCPSSD